MLTWLATCLRQFQRLWYHITTPPTPVLDDPNLHILPSTGTAVSAKRLPSKESVGWSRFELTVVNTTGLRGATGSSSRRFYVTASIADEVFQTKVTETNNDPEWKDTFSFMAQDNQNIVLTVYAVRTRGDRRYHVVLGRIEESIISLKSSGYEISRDIPETRNGGLFTLNFRFGPRSRLYGLIIGIDKYKSQEIPDLKGSVGDAQSMMNCLSDIYHVPADHFLFLANDGATRNAIITGFRNHLIQNNDIQRDDAIVVFYAGYGSQVVARKGWVSDGSKVETICPHDERTLDQRGQEILGIPDRTIDALLRRLASAKGDNITVIFDSCHSGGITRAGMVPRFVECSSLLPEDLDVDVWTKDLPRATAISVPTGFMYKTMTSHVLLAACRQDESAWEISFDKQFARGAFTNSLVKQLYQEDVNYVTYTALLHLLPALEQQHPQCEGTNKNRILFNQAARAHEITFRLSIDGGKYIAEAGGIHGVVKGTLFAIHAIGMDLEIGILEADSVRPHLCTLRRRRGDIEFDIPPGARALVLNWRQDENVLKVFMEPPCDEIQSIEHIFSLVDSSERADLVVRCTEDGALHFERLDPLMSKYTPALNDVPSGPGLPDILRGVSHFNFHLSRRNSANPLKQLVQVVLQRLKQSNPEEITEEPIYMPDEHFDMPLVFDRENTVFIPNRATTAFNSNRTFYGLTIKNHSARKLFTYLIYFDPSDYSIQSWYQPPSGTIATPLAERRRDGRPSELPVGYGFAGGDALEFSLADGITADIGFLKIFVSTSYVDMSALEQESPFHAARGTKRAKPPSIDLWDTWTCVLRTQETGE